MREASAVNISYILNSFQIGYDRRVSRQDFTAFVELIVLGLEKVKAGYIAV